MLFDFFILNYFIEFKDIIKIDKLKLNLYFVRVK